jgi:hypothetical protein
MLSSLQASVEKEETAWRLKLATLEEELRKVGFVLLDVLTCSLCR